MWKDSDVAVTLFSHSPGIVLPSLFPYRTVIPNSLALHRVCMCVFVCVCVLHHSTAVECLCCVERGEQEYGSVFWVVYVRGVCMCACCVGPCVVSRCFNLRYECGTCMCSVYTILEGERGVHCEGRV